MIKKPNFLKSEVIKNISILASGTLFAQLIPLFAAPIIARLFNADEFGEFAAIMGIVQVASVVINGRYELAIVLPKKENDAIALLLGNWFLGCFASSLVVVIIILLANKIEVWLGLSLFWFHYTIIFISLLGLMIWQPVNYYFIRLKSFVKMTYTKFFKSLSIVTFTLFFGYFKGFFGLNGLLLGFGISWICTGVYSFFLVSQQTKQTDFNVSEKIRLNLKKFNSYPKYNLLPAVINTMASQLGLYAFIFFFSTEVSGYFSFSKQYLYGPMSILGVSLSQVYFQRVSEKFQNRKSVVRELKILALFLLAVGSVLSLIIITFSVEIFDFVFGEKWREAAIMSKLLVFAFSIQFLVSPLSNVLHALNRVKLASIFPFLYILSLSILFLLPKMELNTFLGIYVMAEIIPYCVYLIIISWAVLQYEKSLINT